MRLERLFHLFYRPKQLDFNTNIVRLELGDKGLDGFYQFNFNTNIVRLERKHGVEGYGIFWDFNTNIVRLERVKNFEEFRNAAIFQY